MDIEAQVSSSIEHVKTSNWQWWSFQGKRALPRTKDSSTRSFDGGDMAFTIAASTAEKSRE
jgi:hypothetical protein